VASTVIDSSCRQPTSATRETQSESLRRRHHHSVRCEVRLCESWKKPKGLELKLAG
jgi:hypothetical protein